jgi:hypothetical protein
VKRSKPIKRRRRLAAVSEKRQLAAEQDAVIREAVFDRDGRRCCLKGALPAFGRCYGPLTPHHLRKAGQGGPYSMRNLITLCAFHNGRIESMPRADMEALGLVIPRWQDTGTAWALLQLAGIVAWWWDGTPADRPRPDAMHAVLGQQDPQP